MTLITGAFVAGSRRKGYLPAFARVCPLHSVAGPPLDTAWLSVRSAGGRLACVPGGGSVTGVYGGDRYLAHMFLPECLIGGSTDFFEFYFESPRLNFAEG